MEYQKIINFLDNTPNQPTKVKTKNWVEINYDARGPYNKDNQIKLKASILKQVYVIIVMYIFLKGLYQSHHKQETVQIM